MEEEALCAPGQTQTDVHGSHRGGLVNAVRDQAFYAMDFGELWWARPGTTGAGLTPALIRHSHARAIFDAAAQNGVPLRGFNFWTAPQPAVSPDLKAFHPSIRAVLAEGVVFSVVGGATHNVLAMVSYRRPFDFILPERPDLPLAEGAEVLPFGAVHEAMAAAVKEYLDIIGLIRPTAADRVIHIEAPPPLEDGGRIAEDVPWMFFQDFTRKIAPAALRWKCWRLHSMLVEAYCRQQGVEMLKAPKESMDAGGFLRPEYYLDTMHVKRATALSCCAR